MKLCVLYGATSGSDAGGHVHGGWKPAVLCWFPKRDEVLVIRMLAVNVKLFWWIFPKIEGWVRLPCGFCCVILL